MPEKSEVPGSSTAATPFFAMDSTPALELEPRWSADTQPSCPAGDAPPESENSSAWIFSKKPASAEALRYFEHSCREKIPSSQKQSEYLGFSLDVATAGRISLMA